MEERLTLLLPTGCCICSYPCYVSEKTGSEGLEEDYAIVVRGEGFYVFFVYAAGQAWAS